jgi:hypothetical protein
MVSFRYGWSANHRPVLRSSFEDLMPQNSVNGILCKHYERFLRSVRTVATVDASSATVEPEGDFLGIVHAVATAIQLQLNRKDISQGVSSL